MSYIENTHISTANLYSAVRLYAGRGWLSLVREALALIGDSTVMAIREDAGALRIELDNSTAEQRAALVEISQRSLTVCEVCGEPGLLRFEGVKAGIPAGWHRTRCDQHVDTRASSGLESSENLLVIDLEATCESPTPEGYHNQTIEIGAVWVTARGEVLDTFETLVRADQPISEFCTSITTITQAQSDSGLSFPEAAAALAEFANLHPGKTWASWGGGDLKMIERDCAYHGVENPLAGWAHRNLKVEYHKAKPKIKKLPHVGMKRAMVELGIPQEGAHHRALPDALNVARVFAETERRTRLNCWGDPK